jgi:Tol biopolymer transport system component
MRAAYCLPCAAIAVFALSVSHAQDAQPKARRPERAGPGVVITPHTIRVQPTDPDGRGHWITMPGYGELGSPCFSRNGRWVAFDAYKEGFDNSHPECWVARWDGTGLRKLADGATPRWSPDGQRLLFIRGVETDPKQEPDVYVIKPDGTGERKLGPGRWPDWSPDGRRIVFSRGGRPGGGAKVGATVYILDADGLDRKALCDGDCPSWSPDGKSIASCFREPDQPPMIRVIDLETKEVKTLGIGWFRANWMPDGKTVVANGPAGFEGVGMVKLSVDGLQAPRQLFSQFDDASSPCPSSDEAFMVFVARRPKPSTPAPLPGP